MRLQSLYPASVLRRRTPPVKVKFPGSRAALLLFALAGFCRSGLASTLDQSPKFKYVGGTEHVQQDCVGALQIGTDALTYRCAADEVGIPYRDIEAMQYRADVTRRVRKMKVKWIIRPPDRSGGSKNRYFVLLYRVSGSTHVLVLEVSPDQMRPYLAEIDLKVGRRVEVQSHEDFSP